jgi:hypothetical protein
MTALGACVIEGTENPVAHFQSLLKPLHDRYDPETFAVSGLDRTWLQEHGEHPKETMERFETFVLEAAHGTKPVLVAYGLGKEWLFVDWYFWHFLGRNPFGHNGIDMNSYAMGAFGISTWEATSLKRLPPTVPSLPPLTHVALEDAILQGQTFAALKCYRERQM